MLKTDYKFGEVFTLTSQVEKNEEKVEFKDIMNNGNGGIVMLAFSAGQELATHIAPAEVMVYVVDGDVIFTITEHPHHLHKGEFLLMGDGVPHSVRALTDAKIMLVKIKHD